MQVHQQRSNIFSAIFQLAFCVGWLTGTGISALGATQADARLENVQIGLAAAPETRIKVGTWTPVWTSVVCEAGRFQGFVELSTPDEQGNPTVVRTPVSCETAGETRVLSYLRPGLVEATVTVRLLDSDGVALDRPRSFRPTSCADWATRLVGKAGSLPGIDDVAQQPKFAGEASGDGRLLAFTPLADWPRDPLGLDGLAVIAISTEDRAIVDALRAGGAETLRTWVARGGHAVISIGPRGRENSDLFGDLLPAEIGAASSVNDVGAIETFAGSTNPPLRGQVLTTRLTAREGRNAIVLAFTPQTPLVVRGAYGLGRVTVTGLDLASAPVADWANRALLWDKLIDLRGRLRDNIAQVSETRGALVQASSTELGSRLQQSLDVFPSVALIPFGWVAFLIFAYLLVIGPLDYWFLRRVVKRMEWTWLTFPVVVAATTLGAYAAATALKGTEPRINKLDLIDLDQTSGQVRGASWWTLYTAANRDYDLTLKPVAPDLRAATPWALASDQTCTWFAADKAVLMGVGRVALGTRPAEYGPPGSVSHYNGVRIPIWSTRGFTGRWWGEAEGLSVVEADLRTVAGDRASGSIRNLTDHSLKNAQLFYGRNAYQLGTIRPRGIGRVDFSRAEAIPRLLSRTVQTADSRQQGEASGTEPGRIQADLLRVALLHDALGTRADAWPSHVLADLDLTSQAVELRRPVLVAEVDAPAAQLEVKGDPKQPRIDQTTLVRLILDIDHSAN